MSFPGVPVPGLEDVKHSEFVNTNELYLHYKTIYCTVATRTARFAFVLFGLHSFPVKNIKKEKACT